MSELNQHHWKAIAVSGVFTLMFVVAGVWYVTHEGKFLFQLESKPTVETTGPTEQELADIMRWYIRSLAAYDQNEWPPIIFLGSEEGTEDTVRMNFKVEGSKAHLDVVLLVNGWHVLGHELTVRTPDGSLSVTSPEPGQIASPSIPLVVKGRAPSVSEVTLSVWAEPQGSLPIFEQVIAVTDAEFFYSLPLQEFTPQELYIVVKAGESTVSIPVSLDTYAQ
jgi:hypothetical protein